MNIKKYIWDKNSNTLLHNKIKLNFENIFTNIKMNWDVIDNLRIDAVKRTTWYVYQCILA